LADLQSEVTQVIDNFQIEIMRQFQIQQGSIENLLGKYMEEPEPGQDEEPIPNKYFQDDDLGDEQQGEEE